VIAASMIGSRIACLNGLHSMPQPAAGLLIPTVQMMETRVNREGDVHVHRQAGGPSRWQQNP